MKLLPSQSARHARRGVALVIVLAFLVLLSTLIIAFFSSVQLEAQSSANYGASVAAKQLVQSALHVAMGQVSDATKSTKTPGSAAAADRIAWASQPGMIRTWDADGSGWKIFKLYSAKDMVVDFKNGSYSTADELATEVPSDWAGQSAMYTDLNSPVLVADTTGLIDRNGVKFRAEYPIIDPLALGVKSDLTDRVEGFNLNVAPGYGGATSTDPKTGLPQPAVTASTDPSSTTLAGKTANPAPMPVAWMYVLKDGTLTVPSGTDPANPRIAKFGSGQYAPSATNPIVGRVAFWGDDESCKINLNTSSEPTPWDTPRAASKKDFYNGLHQPVNREYQRYPGHPAMTALSPILIPGKTLTTADKEAIYSLIPRVRNGGSMSGTVALASPPVAMPDDNERLLANVDEFIFDPKRIALTAASIIDPERLKRSRFFLTANSRAPEVNLFGGPRISLWPVSKSGTRSPYDKLASFCATLGAPSATNTNQYYFQRNDSKHPTTDYTGIARNQQLYKYLQNITGDTASTAPGFGGSLKKSWGQDRDQVLTQIFDYIRCINLSDNQGTGTVFSSNGQVVPIEVNGTSGLTRGFGRIHTISQFGIQFICNRDDKDRDPPISSTKLPNGDRQIEAAILFTPFNPSLGWFQVLEDLCVQVKIDKPVTVGGGTLYDAGSTYVIKLNNSNSGGYHLNERPRGGLLGFRGLVKTNGGGSYPLISKQVTLNGVDATKPTMKFDGLDMTVTVYSGNSVDPSKLLQTFTISMPAATFPAPDLVLSGSDNYYSSKKKDPNYWWRFSTRFSDLGSHPQAPGPEYKDPNRRWAKWNTEPGFMLSSMFRAEDVVRSVVPDHGDARLIAAKKTIDKSVFVPIGASYHDSKIHFSDLFGEISGTHLLYGFGNEPTGTQIAAPVAGSSNPDSGTIAIAQPGDQLTAAKYHWSHLPEISPGAGKKYNKFGDFDNGVAQSTDGAYINKPDEGNQSQDKDKGHWPYFQWSYKQLDAGYFSPNRLVASAGMLGSLPTGVLRHKDGDPRAWQTLLFRPQKGHPGDPGYAVPASSAKNPTNKAPDHLVMDLFWMPVVEPYAISEPFSTAGKINMNYEIAPFSYIRRATALHGAMKSEEPLAVPNDAADIYKLADHETASNLLPDEGARGCVDQTVLKKWISYVRSGTPTMREPLDIEKTLTQFDSRFKAGEIFRSATQVCEVHLVSKGATLADYEQTVSVNGASVPKFWNEHVVTGDNARERPYSNLYARLTTKSNVFTIHVRAQVLRKATTTNAAQWDEDKDRVTSEHRGSTMIERYIDAADPTLPDFASPASADTTLDANYRFRMVATKKFAP